MRQNQIWLLPSGKAMRETKSDDGRPALQFWTMGEWGKPRAVKAEIPEAERQPRLDAILDDYFKRVKCIPVDSVPTMDDIQSWVMDSVCEATDGCQVEPDGRCEHGAKSWLLTIGII